jgi:hypothetical protein
MKVTNISPAEMKIKAKDGIATIPAGKSVNVEFTAAQLERARNRSYLVLDEPEQAKPAAKAK